MVTVTSPSPLASEGSTVLGICKKAKLKVKRHSETATLPVRQTALSVGYDLCSDEDVTLPPGERKAIETNISIEVPPGHYGRIAPRSGLAVKQGINVMVRYTSYKHMRPYAQHCTHTLTICCSCRLASSTPTTVAWSEWS